MKRILQNIRPVLLVLLMITGVSNASAALSVTLTNNSASTVGVGDEISLTATARNFGYDYWSVFTFSYYTEAEPTKNVVINTQTEKYPSVSYKFHPTKAGKYHFKVTLAYGTTTSVTSNDVPVTVEAPTVSLASDLTEVDAGNSITLTATPGYGTPKTYTYSYSTDNGANYTQIKSSSSKTTTYMPTQAGTYLFRVITSDGTNTATSDPVSVIVNAVNPYVIISATPTTTAVGGTITLTATPICCTPSKYYFRRKIGDETRLINEQTSNVCTYTPAEGETGTYSFYVIADYTADGGETKSLYSTNVDVVVGQPSGIKYIDANGDEQVCTYAEEVVTNMTSVTWPAGWYVVKDANVELPVGVCCTGDVHLILADDSKLTVTAPGDYYSGISVGADNTLTIYGQANNSGELVVTGGNNCAAIGDNGGNVIINGGKITAKGGSYAPGIGAGYEKTLNSITINGGNITANGGDYGTGIGTGFGEYDTVNEENVCSVVNAITINGGTITANGGSYGAGIGSAPYGESGITINGGTITATGGVDASGIGAEDEGYCDHVDIYGGTINASRGRVDKITSCGIGSQTAGSCARVSINNDLAVFAGDSAKPTTLFEDDNTTETVYNLKQGYVYIPGIKVLPSVTLNEKGLATYSAGSNATIYTSDVKAYTAKVSGTTITLNKIDDDILKDNGIVLYGTAGTKVQILESTKESINNSDNDLKPTTTSTVPLVSVPTSGYNYVMGSDGLFHPYTGSTFAANRAYFNFVSDPLAASGAKFSMVFDDDTTTAIEDVLSNGTQQAKTSEIYNISGQKVGKDYKGIVIINGKKVIK